jgi:hypothetical protein
VTDSDGRSDFGESLPRPYVTGETTDTMIARIRQQLAPQILQNSFASGWETFEYLQWGWRSGRETMMAILPSLPGTPHFAQSS